jgi:L-ascorbate metabolism protein UlaG (beta-lactamase superfamily)
MFYLSRMRFGAALVVGLLCVAGFDASAQDRRASHCIAIADSTPGLQYLHKAAWADPLPDFTVRLQYIAHASFLIQTPGGLNAVTDFTGFIGTADLIPDVVTMNHAHDTHWTAFPDPAIAHVLPGWGPFGEGIDHNLDLGEMLVRNVSTDIRSQFGGAEDNGNSIFVFEAAGLCIGHLGHLHHVPNDEQFAALGRLDVVMAPVDGGLTLPIGDMISVLQRLKSSVVIPMHWFSGFALDTFLTGMSGDFAIERPGTSSIEVSLRSLPDRPTVVVLSPAFLTDAD